MRSSRRSARNGSSLRGPARARYAELSALQRPLPCRVPLHTGSVRQRLRGAPRASMNTLSAGVAGSSGSARAMSRRGCERLRKSLSRSAMRSTRLSGRFGLVEPVADAQDLARGGEWRSRRAVRERCRRDRESRTVPHAWICAISWAAREVGPRDARREKTRAAPLPARSAWCSERVGGGAQAGGNGGQPRAFVVAGAH